MKERWIYPDWSKRESWSIQFFRWSGQSLRDDQYGLNPGIPSRLLVERWLEMMRTFKSAKRQALLMKMMDRRIKQRFIEVPEDLKEKVAALLFDYKLAGGDHG